MSSKEGFDQVDLSQKIYMSNSPPNYNDSTQPQAVHYGSPPGMGTTTQTTTYSTQPGISMAQGPSVVISTQPQQQGYSVHASASLGASSNLGPSPTMARCSSCGGQYMSKVDYENTTKTHIFALVLLSVCCCCIPYCVNSCKSANHHCSHCGAYLGSYNNTGC